MFRKENKYLVLKQDDIEDFLTERQKGELNTIIDDIGRCREAKGKKPFNTYVVVNEDEPYAHIVWDLIELGEKMKDE